MPVIKSAKKRAKQSEKRRLVNTARKSAIKTAVKRVVEAIELNEVAKARELLKDAEAKLARAKNKGTFHANTVARKIGRLAKRVAAAERPAA
jgi:small subunit ribosomal protein S20